MVTVKGSRKISCVEGRGGAFFADTERRCRLAGTALAGVRGFVGAWQAQVKPTPLPYAKLLLVIGEKSSTLALHEIEDVNAKKEGQKQVR